MRSVDAYNEESNSPGFSSAPTKPSNPASPRGARSALCSYAVLIETLPAKDAF